MEAILIKDNTKVNSDPWSVVIEKARQIKNLSARLDYLIQNQPDLPLQPDLTPDKLIVRPEYWTWWKHSDGSEKYYIQRFDRKQFATIKEAILHGISPQDVIIGFYMALPWSWEDRHIFGNEAERARDILAMVMN